MGTNILRVSHTLAQNQALAKCADRVARASIVAASTGGDNTAETMLARVSAQTSVPLLPVRDRAHPLKQPPVHQCSHHSILIGIELDGQCGGITQGVERARPGC